MDSEQLLVTMRIDSAKEAITRLRLALLVAVIASSTVMLTVWNGYFSWYRFFVLEDQCRGCPLTDPTKIAQDQLVKAWVDSLIINISPLGMHFGVSDLAFVAPVALVLLTSVMFFCARRENHAVSYLMIDFAKSQTATMLVIFHAVSAHLVFLPLGATDDAIGSLAYNKVSRPRGFISKRGFDLLVFLPVIAVAMILAADILSVVYLPAPFRLGHPVLWNNMDRPEVVQFFLMELVPLAMGTLVVRLCWLTRKFSYATVQVIRDFQRVLSDSDDRDSRSAFA
ncbi:MAG TPA: hypothetical protein VGN17_26605 [Bryobacteraceae bacterium]|jgi:hypothetical protein